MSLERLGDHYRTGRYHADCTGLFIEEKAVYLADSFFENGAVSASVIKIGIAPFGLPCLPISPLSLSTAFLFLWREPAIATYACIAYVICIIYLILQGVGDGSQPLISRCYGEKKLGGSEICTEISLWICIFNVCCWLYHYVCDKRKSWYPVWSIKRGKYGDCKDYADFSGFRTFRCDSRITTASFYATERALFLIY